MKNTLPFLLLVICVLGCSKFGPDTASTSNTSANNSAPKIEPKKMIDVPSLLGKSTDEVKKIVGSEPKDESAYTVNWSVKDSYDLGVDLDKGKAKAVNFALPGGLGADKPEQIAVLAGVDLAGKTPDFHTESFTSYKGLKVGSGTAEATFHQIGETFRSVRLEMEKAEKK